MVSSFSHMLHGKGSFYHRLTIGKEPQETIVDHKVVRFVEAIQRLLSGTHVACPTDVAPCRQQRDGKHKLFRAMPITVSQRFIATYIARYRRINIEHSHSRINQHWLQKVSVRSLQGQNVLQSVLNHSATGNFQLLYIYCTVQLVLLHLIERVLLQECAK